MPSNWPWTQDIHEGVSLGGMLSGVILNLCTCADTCGSAHGTSCALDVCKLRQIHREETNQRSISMLAGSFTLRKEAGFKYLPLPTLTPQLLALIFLNQGTGHVS